MPPPTLPDPFLPTPPPVTTLNASLTSITKTLDTIFINSLKPPRPRTRDLRNYKPHLEEIYAYYAYYMAYLAADGPRDEGYQRIQVYAFERAVCEFAGSLADRARWIAERVGRDREIEDEVKRGVVRELGNVVGEAREVMRDVMRRDVAGAE